VAQRTADWNQDVAKIDQLLNDGHAEEAVIKIGKSLERLMRELYQLLSLKLRSDDWEAVLTTVKEIGANKPIAELMLGQLFRVFERAKLFEKVERVLHVKVDYLKAMLPDLIRARNETAHDRVAMTGFVSMPDDQARLYSMQLRRVLSEAGLLDVAGSRVSGLSEHTTSSPIPDAAQRLGPIGLVRSTRNVDIVRGTLREWLEKIPGVTNFSVGLTRDEAKLILTFMRRHDFNVDLSYFKRREAIRDLTDAWPSRQISLNAFCLSRFLVSNRLFSMFVEAEDFKTTAERTGAERTWRTFAIDDTVEHPVRCLSYDDAEQFCVWAGFRLPTSDEYECAVRGTERRLFPWGSTWEEGRCNDVYFPNKPHGTTHIKKFVNGASQHGIHDLAGNVFEWVRSGDGSAEVQLLAGGSYRTAAVYRGHAAARVKEPRSSYHEEFGFRVAQDVGQSGPRLVAREA
jgi:hypothetical protein